jgi:hypothetical protein
MTGNAMKEDKDGPRLSLAADPAKIVEFQPVTRPNETALGVPAAER